MSGAVDLLGPVTIPPPPADARQAPLPTYRPRPLLKQWLISLAREAVLAGLLGAAASGLAFATGVLCALGEPRLAAAFAALAVLIVLYVAMCRPLDPATLEHKE